MTYIPNPAFSGAASRASSDNDSRSISTNSSPNFDQHNGMVITLDHSSSSSSSSNNVNVNVNGIVATSCDTKYRAVHQIALAAISHNYNCVEAAASQQQCDVIVVVKADGYGHGAIDTAIHLADSVGAAAFAVATLEEGISLRKALVESAAAANANASSSTKQQQQQQQQQKRRSRNSSGGSVVSSNSVSTATTTTTTPATTPSASATTTANGGKLSNLFDPPSIIPAAIPVAAVAAAVASDAATVTTTASTVMTTSTSKPFRRRAPWIRILVLGPPVGYPQCFDDYYYHNIECCVSGPEVATALYEWATSNPVDIQRRVVERVAQETKDAIVANAAVKNGSNTGIMMNNNNNNNNTMIPEEDESFSSDENTTMTTAREKSATLSGTSGNDLAKEFRQLLLNHQRQKEAMASFVPKSSDSSDSGIATPTTSNAPSSVMVPKPVGTTPSTAMFGGIEAAALDSRHREKAAQHAVWVEDSESAGGTATTTLLPSSIHMMKKRRLRWHALVDTGMGRLGFKTDAPASSSERRDTVDILLELVRAEQLVQGAPLEFYGMCTHMAEASSTSTYTNDQIIKFKALLKRVRDAGISIPTVSTDNSAALLTTSLKHFDPHAILVQPGLNTRGFVRTGGAIYGQRPAFTQLQAASTLQAAVRHVAILKQGESVGYDRAYIAPHNVRIATLTIGFADGYPRELGNGRGQVAIRSKLYPVAGNVCMDMMMVELGPSEEESNVVVGDVAILWGGPVPLQDVAAALSTTQSALTCGLNKTRVSREYIL